MPFSLDAINVTNVCCLVSGEEQAADPPGGEADGQQGEEQVEEAPETEEQHTSNRVRIPGG